MLYSISSVTNVFGTHYKVPCIGPQTLSLLWHPLDCFLLLCSDFQPVRQIQAKVRKDLSHHTQLSPLTIGQIWEARQHFNCCIVVLSSHRCCLLYRPIMIAVILIMIIGFTVYDVLSVQPEHAMSACRKGQASST